MSHQQGTAISLFSGAGGLDLGISDVGFNILLALDRERLRSKHTKLTSLRGRRTRYLCADILDLQPNDVRRGSAGLSVGASLDLLVGGPPCTPFSKSAYWLDWKCRGLIRTEFSNGLRGVTLRNSGRVSSFSKMCRHSPRPRAPYRPTDVDFIQRLDRARLRGMDRCTRRGGLRSAPEAQSVVRRRSTP